MCMCVGVCMHGCMCVWVYGYVGCMRMLACIGGSLLICAYLFADTPLLRRYTLRAPCFNMLEYMFIPIMTEQENDVKLTGRIIRLCFFFF